ncbi:MAG: aldo/keto reductase [Planctomycetota bacterium]|jgi:aryl-alcohol dehydrogenase-like predicted oxidoreductase
METHNKITRRRFLGKVIGGTTAAIILPNLTAVAAKKSKSDGKLAKRVLGRTKEKVTILGLGTAPVGEGPIDVAEGIRIFGAAIDRGVNYIDTARIYGNAEEILGHVIPKKRDKLFVVTKVSTDSAEKAERSLGESSKNIDRVLAKDGSLNFLLKQKEKGKIRFIGISGHNRPANFVRMIKTDQIDVIMCVINYADRNIYDFETKVLPEARKRNIGCVAMKVYVGIKGGFRNHRKGYVGCVTEPANMPQAISYALDLKGVSVAVVGPYTLEHSIQNVGFAKKYKPLSKDQLSALMELGKKLAPDLGPRYGPVT